MQLEYVTDAEIQLWAKSMVDPYKDDLLHRIGLGEPGARFELRQYFLNGQVERDP